MRDFTLTTYKSLILAFQQAGYQFQTFEDAMTIPAEGKLVVMRHDVDELAWNALRMAQLENRLGIRSTYYFRIVKQSNVPEVIKQIVALGHEVGYHYEDLSLNDGNQEKAMASFKKNLAYFRTFYPVRTVSMHGSSTSKHDNRLFWECHKMADYGLVGEPYLSVDFNKVFYLTDTGYAWDGSKFATRDIVDSHFGLKFHATHQIVESIGKGEFPERTLILAHTLWTDSLIQWNWLHIREFLRNNLKLLAMNNKAVARLYGKMVNLHWKI